MNADRDRWQLGAGSFWADELALVGGDPFRSMRLKRRGAVFVRAVLDENRVAASHAETALLQRLARANLLVQPTRAPAPVSDVTLVVPAKSNPAAVQAVLDSAPGVPAIVVDDGSPVPLADRLHHSAELRVLRNNSSLGPAAARNRGARCTSMRWVVFCDADVRAPAGWISALLPYLDGNLAVAPRIVTAAEPSVAGRFERAVCALDMGTTAGYVSPAGVLSYVPSAALLVDRAGFLALGGFDESMRVGEDVDFIWRAAEAGVYFEPTVVLEHRPRASLSRALERRAAYGESAAALAAKHPTLMRHGSFPVAAALPWLLTIAGRPKLAAIASLAHVALAPRSIPGLPPAAARRAAVTGQSRSALALSRMLIRPLLPATLMVSLLSKGFRRRALCAALASTAIQTRSVSKTGWQVVDDAAYSTGAWRAALRARRIGFLLPQLRFGGRRG